MHFQISKMFLLLWGSVLSLSSTLVAPISKYIITCQHFKVNFPHCQTAGQSHLQHHRVRVGAEEEPEGGESDATQP